MVQNLLRTAFTFCLSIFFLTSFAQEGTYDAAWEKFVANDYEGALDEFTNANNGTLTPEAYLGRYFSKKALYKDDATEDLRMYFQTADDPTIALRALWEFHYGDKSDEDVEFLENIQENHTGTLQGLATEALATWYRTSNELDDAQEMYEELHTIDRWAVLGEFENISESGFNGDFGALENPHPDALFYNKVGAEVQWFEIAGPRHDKWVDLEYFFYASNSIIYAQNFLASEIDQDVQFRLGVSGSVKVWVNDKLMFSEADERNNGLDSYIFTAHLNRGFNRVLIQMGESEAGNCNFMLRITDDAGNHIQGLSTTTELQSYQTEQSFESTTIPDAVIAHYTQEIEQNPNDILNYLILSEYYRLTDNGNAGKVLLNKARELFPENIFLSTRMLLAYLRDGNSTQMSTLVEEIKVKSPDNVLALNLRFSEAMDIEDYEQAEGILNDLHRVQGNTTNYYDKKIQLASAQEDRELVFETIEIAYNRFPLEWDFVNLMYLVEKDVNSNPRRALNVLDDYTDERYSPTALRKMASHYFGQQTLSGLQEGMDIYEELIENEPIAIGYYNTLSKIKFAMRRYDDAEEYALTCTEMAPYLGGYYSSLAEIYKELDRTTRAEVAYAKAIYYDPYDYDSRHALRELQGLDGIFENFEETDVYQAAKVAPDADAYPEDNALIVVDDNQHVFYKGGGNEERHIFVVKVLNVDGVDSWKEFRVPVSANQNGIIEKAETIKANGSRVAAETSGAQVVFENLEPGDAIHVTYRLESHHSGKLTNHIWGSEFMEFYIPTLSTNLALIVPEGTNLQYKVENGDVDFTTDTLRNGEVAYRWSVSDVPAIRYESGMPPLADVGTTVHYTTFDDWNFVSDWYTDLVRAKAKKEFEVDMAVEEIFPSGYEGMSDYDKARAIHDYIVENVRYRSVSFLQSGLIPQSASTTLTAKQGDCKDVSVLFATLCAEVGLDANLVLVNTRNNGTKEMMLPSINFNHCIASVKLDTSDVPYFVELTSDKISFATRTSDIEGAFILPIPLNSDEEVEAYVSNDIKGLTSQTYRNTEVSFEGSNISVTRNTIKTGISAAGIRNRYRDEGPVQQEKYMQDAISNEYPGIKLTNVEFTKGLTENVDSVHYTYSYEANDVTSRISSLEIFEVPFSDGFKSGSTLIAMEERKYPIELWESFSSRVYDEEIELTIPAGKRLAEVPEDVIIEVEDFSYKVTFKKRGNVLHITRHFEILDDLVAPEDYPEFKSALEAAIKADTQNLAFQ
ncbi:DUF3857 domain-containing protein [Phaeocystidibacter luteus]|uniref:DUF3857 domain-containing protein n=1 Tax=Phaeocystidibacter luteus TaxID=911197 RepID=A0A6N6RF80_9FLAO|nr:DUF3857 domain-containing protein [Phaeocystidibacter luteus]KAB2805341.1 DUF3857 domain-containing protein [Phaeocystidibacter luteus]